MFILIKFNTVKNLLRFIYLFISIFTIFSCIYLYGLDKDEIEYVSEETLDDSSLSILIGDLVNIDGGCFLMGSPLSEIDRFPREMQNERCFEPFLIGKYEITNQQYIIFLNNLKNRPQAYYLSTQSGILHLKDGLSRIIEDDDKYKVQKGFENYPVSGISWYGAHAYTVALSKWTGSVYRLPKEAEWEYAARGGTTTRFWWGDDPNYMEICKFANIADISYGLQFPGNKIADCDDKHTFIAKIGSFPPNPYGLYDMFGNVWEWTCSLWNVAYGEEVETCTNSVHPQAFVSGRSGSWDFHPIAARSAFRSADRPGNGHNHDGFRIIKVPEPMIVMEYR